MDATLVKALSEAGIGIASIAALVFVVIYQVKMFAKIDCTMAENTKNLIMNTEATREMKEVLQGMNGAINGCKFNKNAIR